MQLLDEFFMGNFKKALLKSNKIRSVCLPICIVLDNSSISMISCVFSESVLNFIEYVQFSKVFRKARSNDVL